MHFNYKTYQIEGMYSLKIVCNKSIGSLKSAKHSIRRLRVLSSLMSLTLRNYIKYCYK